MHKKLISLCSVIALIGGLLVVGASPALATDPPASFLPDEDGAGADSGLVLSDRFDGTDQLAHLTAVSPNTVDRMDWFACPTVVTDPVDQAELTQCNVAIGSDTTGTTPTAGTTFVPADEAYDVFWDIPTGLDTTVRDILALACVGAGNDVEGSGQNCIQTLEENVELDDAAGGSAGQSSSAEITQICTADLDPGTGATTATEPCSFDTNQNGNVTDGTDADTAEEKAAADALFKPFEHGDPVPNTGFVMRATTSPDLAAADLFADIDYDADANQDPDVIDDFDFCSIIRDLTTHRQWECTFPAGLLDDNKEMALWLDSDTLGEGFCNPDAASPDPDVQCVFDSHYHASTDRTATTASKSFDPEPAGPPDVPDISTNAGCETGETPDKAHSSENLNEFFDEEGCFVDQFGDPFDGTYTVETTGVGALDCAGTAHDHNADGIDDHCHGTTSGGLAEWQLFNPNDDPGAQNITFCFDGENGGTSASPPTDHGCADETVKDTNTLTWVTEASQVFLAYSGTASDPNDPCRTGETFKINEVGDLEDLVVCVLDSNGNPIGTEGPGSGSRLQWFIQTSVGGELTGVRFTSSPPTEANDTNGQEIVEIEAFRESSNFIEVELFDEETGDFIDDFVIEKRVEPGTLPTRNVASRVSIFGRFSGNVSSSEQVCERHRLVKVKKVRRGKDKTIGTDGTDNSGAWSISRPRAHGRFYAKVARRIVDFANERLICGSDRSRVVRR